jgi:hypothetical protein
MPAFANVQDFGALGDGVKDNTAEVILARDSLAPNGGIVLFPETGGATQYNIDGAIVFDGTITIGVHDGVKLGGTGNIVIDSPDKLTTFKTSEVFDPALSVLFGDIGTAYPEWFGALGFGMSDDEPAMTRAAFSVAALGGTVHLREGSVYLMGGNVSYPVNVGWSGRGILKPGTGITVDINGPMHEANHDMFDRSLGGIFTMLPTVNNLWNAAKQQIVTSAGGIINLDVALGHVIYHALTENTAFGVPQNAVDGAVLTILLAQPPGGSWTVGFVGAGFRIAGGAFAMSPAGGSTVYDSITFVYHTNINRYVEIGRSQNM